MTTDAGASHKAQPCLCDVPCTVCGTLNFDAMQGDILRDSRVVNDTTNADLKDE